MSRRMRITRYRWLFVVLAVAPAVATVLLIGCGKPLPERYAPSGQTRGGQERLDDDRILVHATGMAETASDAAFHAREAASVALLNLAAVERTLADMRALGDEWRALIESATELRSSEESVASKSGGVRVDADVVVNTRVLAEGVRKLVAAHPPQTQPADAEDDKDAEPDDGTPE